MADQLVSALAELRARATPAQAAVLGLLPPWLQARARLAARDAAVRDALALLPPTSRQAACKELAITFTRYLATGWRHERDLAALPDAAPEFRHALHRLARANDGESLAWQTVRRIAEGNS